MSTQTKEKIDSEAPPIWPPLAHMVPKGQPARKGAVALCGAKLMGIDLPNATKVCRKCLRIANQRG